MTNTNNICGCIIAAICALIYWEDGVLAVGIASGIGYFIGATIIGNIIQSSLESEYGEFSRTQVGFIIFGISGFILNIIYYLFKEKSICVGNYQNNESSILYVLITSSLLFGIAFGLRLKEKIILKILYSLTIILCVLLSTILVIEPLIYSRIFSLCN